MKTGGAGRPLESGASADGRSKRTFDFAIALSALTALAPLLAAVALAVWIEDGGSPWFLGTRVGRGGRQFRMLKFRSMRPNAWKSGVNSTAIGDTRITRMGRWLRKSKLDELPQLWNVLTGEMSLVGPRPQVEADATLYTAVEMHMLDARPGLTDLASIVFADEGEILQGSADPDLLYNQIIRPWKSRLALLYVDRRSMNADARILFLTALALFDRRRALTGVGRLLGEWKAEAKLEAIARRESPLPTGAPPGAEGVVLRYRAAARQAVSA